MAKETRQSDAPSTVLRQRQLPNAVRTDVWKAVCDSCQSTCGELCVTAVNQHVESCV